MNIVEILCFYVDFDSCFINILEQTFAVSFFFCWFWIMITTWIFDNKGWSKKNLTKVFLPYISSTSSIRENWGVFLGALSVLNLEMYLTFFLATKLYKILQKPWIAYKSSQTQIYIWLFLFWHNQYFLQLVFFCLRALEILTSLRTWVTLVVTIWCQTPALTIT